MSQLPRRQRIGLKNELLLALLPTATVLIVLAFIEMLSNQRLLFASLASSAFLIYLDPEHSMNQIRTLVLAQIGAALLGLLSFELFGPGYVFGGVAMVLVIAAMVALDAMHPPAVSTALGFGLKAGNEHSVVLFGLAVAITAVLVILQKTALRIMRHAHFH